MASARDWWTWLRTGQPPAGYDNADAWADFGCVGCGVVIVACVAIVTYLLLR